jgi:transcriptional regulator with XRE-family HTH domain
MDGLTEINYSLPSVAQLVAARSYLFWSQQTLAERSKVGIATIKRLERASELGTLADTLKLATLKRILDTYEREGVTFAKQGNNEVIIFTPRAQESSNSSRLP